MIRVKICGITRVEDALAAVEAGADYLGFIFARSPRRVSASQAAQIIDELPESIERVGVFVDESTDMMRRVAETARLTMLQLHGSEPAELCQGLSLPAIKVFHIEGNRSLHEIGEYSVERILLEPDVAGMAGGTGQMADWDLASEIVRAFPDRKVFLAGGLGPDNVAAAAGIVRPFAVDASSRLESAPGVKDHGKIRRFIQEVRGLC